MDYITSARAAEVNALQQIRSWGFEDAGIAPTDAVDGADLRSSRALGQVRWEAGDVSVADLHRLVEAGGSREVEFFHFTVGAHDPAARQFADDMGVRLFRFDPTGAVSAVNPAAEELLARQHAAPTKPGRKQVSARNYGLLVALCVVQALLAILLTLALVSSTINSTSSAATKTMVFVVMAAVIVALAVGAVVTARGLSRREIV